MKITASLCHDALTATFTFPDEMSLITREQITEELKSGSYKRYSVQFSSDNCSTAYVHFVTFCFFSAFVSWLTNTITKNW